MIEKWLTVDVVKRSDCFNHRIGPRRSGKAMGLGPQNPLRQWLRTLGDMAQCGCQWRSNARNLFHLCSYSTCYFAINLSLSTFLFLLES